MKSKSFKKNLLALLVGAASAQAGAVEIDLGSGTNSWDQASFSESLTLSGQFTQTTPASPGIISGADFRTTDIQGTLLNRADITLDGLPRVSGIQIDSTFNLSAAAGSHITGDINQNGTILLLNTPDATGMEIGNATIDGSVIQSGTIQISAGGNSLRTNHEGIFVNRATIQGNLANTGTIDISAPEAIGIAIDASGLNQVFIGGKVLNSGSVRVRGEETNALEVETHTSALKIENSGLLSATGKDAASVAFYDGTVDYLLNTGTIEGLGDQARSIELRGAHFTQNLASGQRGIINRGTLLADGVAIAVDAADQTSAFEINQQAGLIRSNSGTAINGAHLAELNWSGGQIQGDLLDLVQVNVSGQADFIGQRIVSPLNINSGSLNLAAQGTNISGDLAVASGAAIDMRLSNSVVPGTPYLTVNGNATFAPASKVTLSAKPGDFQANASGTRYTLVQANNLQDHGLSVSSRSALLDVLSYSTDAQAVSAVVGLKSDQQLQQQLLDQGADPSTAQAVNSLKNQVLGRLSNSDPVFQALAGQSTTADLVAQGERLKPDVSRGVLETTLHGQDQLNQAIFSRLDHLRGTGPDDQPTDAQGVWIQGLDSDLDQNRRDHKNGYSANNSVLAVGVDGRLNAATTLGLAYSRINANIHSDLGNKTDVQGHALSLYGNWALQDGFANGSLSYGHNQNDSKRHVAGTTAKGRYDSDQLSMSLLAGYRFRLTDNLLLEPRVATRYARVNMDGFKEHGSSAALDTGSQAYEVGELGAGLRVAGNWPLERGRLQPEASLMTYHDLIGDPVAQTSSFVLGDSAFTVQGAKVARDRHEAKIGLNYALSSLVIGAGYSYQARSGFTANSLALQASYAF
ncbi:autotransporter outer membrane beta-barrel domain-containing protein [Pseudomonas sp. NFXW11]|uniref:autotransporter family protein n=1 Tax=Pseudomonas sp. NFXW11 TaxID=2819531 RepID=UPI003CE8FA58